MAEADDSASRIGYISHAIDKKDLKPGDHIFCNRLLSIYNHHGIYIGERDCEVIHFSADEKGLLQKKKGRQSNEIMTKVAMLAKKRDELPEDSAEATKIQLQIDKIHGHNRPVCIKSTTLDNFLHGSKVRLVSYGSSRIKKLLSFVVDAVHKVKAMPPSETVKLAQHFLKHPVEWGNYSLTGNNCETFACFCKTGRLDIAAQLHQFDRNFVCETDSRTPYSTAMEALQKYREKRTKPRSSLVSTEITLWMYPSLLHFHIVCFVSFYFISIIVYLFYHIKNKYL
ncbi:PREDICTED: uncharacterized protein LOC109588392 [Amphimedon queenslandica]|uniref:LRAT domain-containing protein n=1 Tax=Amphimedon queenslandica TaxID=400682 RepID=A0AAN0JTC0_AMPQE|nr:PREDICTED: uncharacterized protein LOC109588392 [Amphimedon queenslandica]XP_019860125.1 PREDICTED: uncharacterized protein LOC109588392 [Amphimedon queenslandica]|eukprot:XP_019860124.1 PREDICTED: uncharacterized protein LOC109588392 [Amphimedon queenslandica]